MASGCCKVLLVVLFVLGVVRWCLQVPAHKKPPEVAVSLEADDWEESLRQKLDVHGYAHVKGLLRREEVVQLRGLAQTYCYGEQRKALPLGYGGYSVPAFLDIPEFADARWLPKDPRLHRVLGAVFNGTDYRDASHNDVGCDFVGVWHKDVLRGDAAKFQECGVWSPDSKGDRHEIYKVMFYLQDHASDEQSMKVIPGSHVLPETPWERGYVAMHPLMGDAVIFDQRLSHAGNTFYNVFGEGRLFMQVGYGRKNRFTDEFERGTVQRQQTLQARMLKAVPLQGLAVKLQDLKFLVLGSLMTLAPPRLLNYIADKDVAKLAARSCANGDPHESRAADAQRGSEL